MGAQEAAFQPLRDCLRPLAASGDLAGHDLAAAQGDAPPVSLSLMGWPNPANTPFSSSAKVRVPTPAEESRTHIPARHWPAVASQGRGQGGLQLFPAADIDDLHFRSLRRVQRSFHGVIVFCGGFSDADHPISQVQARRLGGVGGAAICPVHIGKAHDERSLENILTPKGVPQTVTLGRVVTTVRMVLTGSRRMGLGIESSRRADQPNATQAYMNAANPLF